MIESRQKLPTVGIEPGTLPQTYLLNVSFLEEIVYFVFFIRFKMQVE